MFGTLTNTRLIKYSVFGEHGVRRRLNDNAISYTRPNDEVFHTDTNRFIRTAFESSVNVRKKKQTNKIYLVMTL